MAEILAFDHRPHGRIPSVGEGGDDAAEALHHNVSGEGVDRVFGKREQIQDGAVGATLAELRQQVHGEDVLHETIGDCVGVGARLLEHGDELPGDLGAQRDRPGNRGARKVAAVEFELSEDLGFVRGPPFCAASTSLPDRRCDVQVVENHEYHGRLWSRMGLGVSSGGLALAARSRRGGTHNPDSDPRTAGRRTGRSGSAPGSCSAHP